jgi:hypothetical protein
MVERIGQVVERSLLSAVVGLAAGAVLTALTVVVFAPMFAVLTFVILSLVGDVVPSLQEARYGGFILGYVAGGIVSYSALAAIIARQMGRSLGVPAGIPWIFVLLGVPIGVIVVTLDPPS